MNHVNRGMVLRIYTLAGSGSASGARRVEIEEAARLDQRGTDTPKPETKN